MKNSKPLDLNSSLHVIVHSPQAQTSEPFAVSISLARLSLYLVVSAAGVLTLAAGTLLFFREVEINRKLQDSVLRLESEKRLYLTHPLPEGWPPPPSRELSTPIAPAISSKSALPNKATTVAGTAPQPATSTTPEAGQVNAEPAPPSPEVFARINELRATCSPESCEIKLGMVTTQPGTAVGKLLLVLETEVPRIGAANPSSAVRKRYFLYPGHQPKDDLDVNQLGNLDQKAFRFTRGLNTKTVFRMGKLLRPLAINAYVFDPDRTLLQHERRVIEPEDS